jgi:predicted transcriptional regulator
MRIEQRLEESSMHSALKYRSDSKGSRGPVIPIFMGVVLMFSYLMLLAPQARAEPGIDYVQIRTAPYGGGEIVGDKVYYVGDQDTYWAAGYNVSGDFVMDVEANWSTRDSGVGWVEPREGTNTTFHAAGEGQTYVSMYAWLDQSGNNSYWYNDTGVLTVLFRGVDYVQIRDRPGGGGNLVDVRSYFVDDTDTYYAAGYNFSTGYMGDIPAAWESDNDTVCTITRQELHAAFKAVGQGVCRVSAVYNGTVTNTTGDITVSQRVVLTVDDDPGADYFTIHEAVENASDGYMIFVYNGTYAEHVLVDRRLIIEGESMENTIVNGGGSGIVFHVTANSVEISRFTVKNAEYGFYLDHCNDTRIIYSRITSYTYGIYSNRTKDAFIAWNTITVGQYGVVTDHAHNDAVRFNDISYNDQYGAKDYDSDLKNCFNWNYFHNNHIAYYYDPEEPVGTLLFNGNRIENNDIGIKASRASALIATDNTILSNGVGIDLVDSSPYIGGNLLRFNSIGIRFSNSAATIYDNYIEGGEYGIMGTGTSPTIEGNTILESDIMGFSIISGTEVRLLRNDLGGGVARLADSAVREISLVRTNLRQLNTTVFTWSLDSESQIDIQWYLEVRVKDSGGSAVQGALVRISDSDGHEIVNGTSASDGLAGPFELTEKVRRLTGDVSEGVYLVEASSEDREAAQTVLMDSNKQLNMAIGPIPGVGEGGIPWIFVGAVGIAGALTVAGLFSVEIFVYFFFALFVPLYTKLRKDQVLDHYSRGRVYQYIEMNPGEHFNSIRRALDLNIGTATYHLEVLSRSGLITSRLDGIYKRFYPTNVPIPPSNGGGISEVQQRVLTVIRDTPGITQKEIARLFGIRQSTLNYQVTRLEEKGLISAEKRGRSVHYFPKQAPPPPPQG